MKEPKIDGPTKTASTSEGVVLMSARTKRSQTLGVALVLSVLPFLLGGCEKARLDEKVRELCAKDGGIKVYEEIKLPVEKFDKWGMVIFYDPTQQVNTLGSDYKFSENTFYYQTGRPEMSRTHYQIFRKSDQKLLGETVLYGRGGGDIPGPWHDSSFHCPDPNEAGSVMLIKRVFVKN